MEAFSCNQCGLCCKRVRYIDPNWPTRADGACIHLNEDNSCAIYETRPAICRVDESKPAGMSVKEWHALNAAACLMLVALAGCGIHAPYEEEAGCFRFMADSPLPTTVQVNAELATTLMRERLGIDFCSLGTIDVLLIDEPFTGIDGRRYSGMAQPLTLQIITHRSLQPLAHEALHVWDFAHLALGSAWHEGWSVNGYLDLTAVYTERMKQ